MIYRKDGFRPFYRAFAVYMLKDRFRQMLQDFPGIERADCMLTYGFIDHDQGFTMEVLALGESSVEGFRFFDGFDGGRFFIRIDALMNDEAWWLEDKQGVLRERYSGKLAALKAYDAPENLERSRGMAVLDSARNFQFVDDVLVTLVRDGFKPEPCWVRIYDLGEHWILGRLLHEPDQDFGCRKGETVAFYLQKRRDGSTECWADLNPGAHLTAQDLEDGSLLRAAVKIYGNERTREHFIDVCEFLRDSFVWVPCKEAEAPEVLQNGDRLYMPVFSNPEQAGEYGQTHPSVRKHFLEAMGMAAAFGPDVSGIVVNAFTDPFVLDRELFEAVARLDSKIGK
ncbi:MAG: SseB family protein [Lachnospiraceae bacterium]|nr:SseB family protein [Lachnospiraceae bacterium]